MDFRNFTGYITISPGLEHDYSPRGFPLYCNTEYDVIIDDRQVEKTDNEFFILFVGTEDQPYVTVDTDTAFVFIVDDDSKLLN